MMQVDVGYFGEVVREGRKMRTTRGPGYTMLKQAYSVQLTDADVRPDFLPKLNDMAAWPSDLKMLDGDAIDFETTHWYDSERNRIGITLRAYFEDLGHAKRAEKALKILKSSRHNGIDVAFVRQVVIAAVEAEIKKKAAEEAASNLAWVAAGIVSEGRRKAREEMQYDDKAKRLRSELANRTENHSIDMAVTVAEEHGFDEADLKAAVEVVLSKPAHFIGSY